MVSINILLIFLEHLQGKTGDILMPFPNRKHVVLSLLTAFAVTTPSQTIAQKLVPLQELISGKKSLQDYTYIMSRCSGLMMEMAQRTSRSPGDNSILEVHFKSGYEFFAFQAATARNKMLNREEELINQSMSEVLDSIMGIQRVYFEKMEEYYFSTGSSVSPQTQSEVDICNGFYQSNIQ